MVGFNYPRFNFFTTNSGISLMLVPRSHNALLKVCCLKLQGIAKLPRSFSFSASFLYMITLHFSERFNVPYASSFLLLLIISFMTVA